MLDVLCGIHKLTKRRKRLQKGANNIVETIGELNCPYCGKVMTNHEYDHATQEFKREAAQEYREQFNQVQKRF